MVRGRTGALLGVVAVGFAVGLAVGGAVVVDRTARSPLLSDQPQAPIVAVPAVVQRTASFAVGLRAAQSTALEAVVSAGGVLTSLEVDVQSPVKDGSLFASVDNKPVFAMIAPVPPIGDLRLGDTGPAVGALQGWLTGLGFEAPTSSTFDRATAAAVTKWQASHPGLTADGVFRAADVVWVGKAEPTVATVLVPPGARVEPGTSILRFEPTTSRIGVTEPADLPAGTYQLQVGAASVKYVAGGKQIVDASDAAAVALALYPGTEGAGRLVAPTAEEVLSVPASAVVTDPTGATCVFPDATGAAVKVTPVGGGLGTVELAGDVELVTVLVNPAAVRTDLACG